jgi:hypothetical protein|tara:strand:+ start:558 stop:695 length:138 start_codon:yes stop_codon:yes gene_type:complete
MTRKNSASGKRKIYGNEVREKVALEAIGGGLTVSIWWSSTACGSP